MSLRGAITSLQTGSYSVKQFSADTYVSGRRVSGAQIGTASIIASIQPATGRELDLLPEARHKEAVRVVYTRTELFVGSATRGPDLIVIDGEDWEVFKCERWQSFGDVHYIAMVSRRSIR